jgi:hypothetical protein
MLSYFTCLALTLIRVWEPPQTRGAEVAPAVAEAKEFVRSRDGQRAVLLIQGLTLRPLSKDAAKKRPNGDAVGQ